MIYLSSFMLSERDVKNPNVYPYHVFRGKQIEPIVFEPITIFYGNNGSGKSTLLNIIANCLRMYGREELTCNSFGLVNYCNQYFSECSFNLGDDEDGRPILELPKDSRYIKSEDILYEIKKIQQKQVLTESLAFDYRKKGKSLQETQMILNSNAGRMQLSNIEYAQEKYSNGETSFQYFEDYIRPDALYLLDEPEVSLSPANQVLLAKELNKMARFLRCQFVIATHSPFMLGTLNAKIYNLDTKEFEITKWSELENIRYFYDFFKERECEFI